MIPATHTRRVADVLAGIRAQAAVADPEARQRVAARTAELGRRLTTAERYELYGEAPPLAVEHEVGDLLYLLATARRAGRIVEFGASHGVSTIHLAAAVRDLGAGTVLTTEILPAKAAATSRNLAAAGLEDVVEILVGDARETLRNVDGEIDMVFLDGRNDLYLPVLELLEPQLAEGAIVAADLSLDDPDLASYLAHVEGADGPYTSLTVPLDAGLAVSVRRG